MNIEKQKETLLSLQTEIEKDLSAIGRKISSGDWIAVPDEGDGATADPIDNADITEDYEEKIAILKVLEKQYTQITNALEAIEQGTYGTCSVCGKEISQDRLKANPTATTCIDHS